MAMCLFLDSGLTAKTANTIEEQIKITTTQSLSELRLLTISTSRLTASPLHAFPLCDSINTGFDSDPGLKGRLVTPLGDLEAWRSLIAS